MFTFASKCLVLIVDFQTRLYIQDFHRNQNAEERMRRNVNEWRGASGCGTQSRRKLAEEMLKKEWEGMSMNEGGLVVVVPNPGGNLPRIRSRDFSPASDDWGTGWSNWEEQLRLRQDQLAFVFLCIFRTLFGRPEFCLTVPLEMRKGPSTGCTGPFLT
jgi:hypothetical protein